MNIHFVSCWIHCTCKFHTLYAHNGHSCVNTLYTNTTTIQLYSILATKIPQGSSKELVLKEIESKLNLIWKKKLYLYLFILYDG